MTQKYQLERVNCLVCDSHQTSIFLENVKELYNNMDEFFNLEECNQCSFVYTNPRPTLDTIGYFYPDSAGYFHPPHEKEFELFKKNSLKGSLLKSYLAKRLNYPFESNFRFCPSFIFARKSKLMHIPTYVKDGNLLDIGCSSGLYLKRMELLKWNTYGLESNSRAATHAQTLLKTGKIINQNFSKGIYPENMFDVVHMSMVLEHLHDPKSALLEIRKILKPGGELILSVPNILGLELTIHKKYAYTLQVPEHVSHFSPQTLQKLLDSTGFKNAQFIFESFDRDLVSPMVYKGKILNSVFHNKLFRKFLIKPFLILMAQLGKTSRMCVYSH